MLCNIKTTSMEQILFLLLICGFVSCGTLNRKTKNKLKSNNDSLHSDFPNNTDIRYSTSLSEFVQTIELAKLCDPVKLYIIFTIDTTGKITDPDFKIDFYNKDECILDSIYIDKLKVELVKHMPLLKPMVVNDTIKKVRLSIPVTFN